jgi:hypothetical protein
MDQRKEGHPMKCLLGLVLSLMLLCGTCISSQAVTGTNPTIQVKPTQQPPFQQATPTQPSPGFEVKLTPEQQILLTLQQLEQKIDERFAKFDQTLKLLKNQVDALSTQAQVPGGWNRELPANQRWQVIFSGEAVLDKETGLVWERTPRTFQQNPPLQGMGWREAKDTCPGARRGGKEGWHLPTIEEFLSLVPLPQTPFVNVQQGSYWTSSRRSVTGEDAAWVIWIGGSVGGINKNVRQVTERYFVWCVRGGQGERE